MKLISEMTAEEMKTWKPAKVGFDVIREIAGKIADAVDPDKIILFGSYAKGEADAHSDIDLLVIMESDEPPYKRSLPIYDLLADYLLPVEVVVRTPEETTWYRDVPSSFIQTVLREGVTLYERQE